MKMLHPGVEACIKPDYSGPKAIRILDPLQ